MSYNMSGMGKYPSLTSERPGMEERVHYERRVTDVVATTQSPQPGRNSYGRIEQALVKTLVKD